MTKGTTHTTAQNPTIEPASRINNIPGAKVYDLTKMIKHPPEPSTTAVKRPLIREDLNVIQTSVPGG
jgi:hypothetical protein